MSSLAKTMKHLIVAALVIVTCPAHEVRQPSTYMTPCFREDLNVNDCLRDTIHAMVLRFKSGVLNALELLTQIKKKILNHFELSKVDFRLYIYGLFGAPEYNLTSLDPMASPDMNFDFTSFFLGGKINVHDIVTRGMANIKIKRVRSRLSDPQEMNLEVDAYFNKLENSGKYIAKGNIARFPLSGAGNFTALFKRMDVTYLVTGESILKNGIQYMMLNTFGFNFPKIGDFKLRTTDLVAGNSYLSRISLRFVNQFWRRISREMYPQLQNQMERYLRQNFNNIFLNIPYDQLIPSRRL